jgi:hypothetical protein
LAPYALTSVNLANPYHKHHFTEDTPRFFTKNHAFRIDPAEVHYPGIRQWGLADSDHSDPKMDFRCVSMDIFHFHPYNTKSDIEKRAARRSSINVAHSIYYVLVAVKAPIGEAELDAMVQQPMWEPPLVTGLREAERQGLAY